MIFVDKHPNFRRRYCVKTPIYKFVFCLLWKLPRHSDDTFTSLAWLPAVSLSSGVCPGASDESVPGEHRIPRARQLLDRAFSGRRSSQLFVENIKWDISNPADVLMSLVLCSGSKYLVTDWPCLCLLLSLESWTQLWARNKDRISTTTQYIQQNIMLLPIDISKGKSADGRVFSKYSKQFICLLATLHTQDDLFHVTSTQTILFPTFFKMFYS